MSYDSKIQLARQIVETHNENVDDPHKVDFDKFLGTLKDMGGTSEETLKVCSWEDLQEYGVPKLLARKFAQLFRQDGDKGSTKSIYVSDKKAKSMTISELLERYNPRDVKNAVGKRLADVSDNKRCIVFDDNGKVNVSVSEGLINDSIDGHPELTSTFIEGIPTPVYKVGERPDCYADENPLYPKRALRSGENCDQTGRSWDGVAVIVRQLLYIARSQTNELKINSLDDAHTAIDKAMSDTAEKIIRQRYPKASLRYDELSSLGQLPVLKLKIGTECSSTNSPFGTNKTF